MGKNVFSILGVYIGVPIGKQSVMVARRHVNAIFIFRRPILNVWCQTNRGLTDIISHVLIHEIGHHLGFSDDDMKRILEEES